MRWVVKKDQAEYMRKRQEENKKKNVEAEKWAEIALKKTNRKWTKQALWGCRIFDFWCAELGIAVEIDGKTHDAEYDNARDKYNFYRSGIIVFRVPNFDEIALQETLKAIEKADSWQIRRVKMREEFGLQEGESFSAILKKIGLKKAHGDWQPRGT
jgi:very-short-patch-repair endonuclease